MSRASDLSFRGGGSGGRRNVFFPGLLLVLFHLRLHLLLVLAQKESIFVEAAYTFLRGDRYSQSTRKI